MNQEFVDKIQFDEAKYRSLKKAHERAVQNREEQFTWNGHDLVTNYAAYLIEYLEMNGYGNNT